MRRFLQFGLTVIMAALIAIPIQAQHWVVYDGSLPPDSAGAVAGADSGIAHSCWEPDAEFVEVIEDDPDIESNKLLYYVLANHDSKAAYKWVAENYSGIQWTMVVRMRGIQGFSGAEHVFDLEIRNGNMGVREKVYIYYETNNIELRYSGQEKAMAETTSVMDWHTYRVTMSGIETKVYLDETEEVFVQGETTDESSDVYWKIGDCASGHGNAAYIDWIAWDTTGAYAPGEGAPLPDSLYYEGRPVNIDQETDGLPAGILLSQNYPNPFNPTTEINFTLPSKQDIQLTVYNALGEKVEVLANGTYTAGKHTVRFQGSEHPAGIYFYEITGNDFSQMRKMVLVK